MDKRKPVDGMAASSMIVLCAIWGMQQVAMKAVSPAMAPVFQVAVRSGIAALVIFLLVLVRREAGALRGGAWKPGLAVGILFALEFLFIGEGLQFTSASHMVIFLYTAPIFAALGLHLKLPEERLSWIQWAGIAIAFAGVVISFVGKGAVEARHEAGASVIGDLLGIAAAVSWGTTTLTIRFTGLSSTPATVTLLYQLAGAFILLLGAALILGQTEVVITPVLLISLGFQIIVVSLVSFLTWFALLRTYLASRLGVLSFMTPIFGVIFGVAMLGDRLDPAFVVGALMVLAGILLVSGNELFGKRSG